MLVALGLPAWEVTAEDVDRVVGAMATDVRAASTRRDYVQVFKGFHRFLTARKAARDRVRVRGAVDLPGG
jgi:integrase/recombinase XerD